MKKITKQVLAAATVGALALGASVTTQADAHLVLDTVAGGNPTTASFFDGTAWNWVSGQATIVYFSVTRGYSVTDVRSVGAPPFQTSAVVYCNNQFTAYVNGPLSGTNTTNGDRYAYCPSGQTATFSEHWAWND